MDEQQLFNWGFAIAFAVVGWFCRTIWQSLNELRTQDSQLADKVNSIEVLVAGDYVKRDYMDKSVAAIFTKLDRIEDKLDKKADKDK